MRKIPHSMGKGPPGWLAQHFAGTVNDGRPEWMLLDTQPLDPDLTARIRTLAANRSPHATGHDFDQEPSK